jgi:hypothetical protein
MVCSPSRSFLDIVSAAKIYLRPVRKLEELFVYYPSSRILFSAIRRDIDEFVRDKWLRETDFVIEITHRLRECLDNHVCHGRTLATTTTSSGLE